MKNIALLIAAACGTAALTCHADTLFAFNITLTGTIIQGGGVAPETVSKENLLKLFGSPSVHPDTVAYFYDETTQSYVLASKDEVNLYGTILTEAQSGGIAWDANSTTTREAGNCTALNGVLSGTYREVDTNGKHSSTESINFLTWGVFNGTDTVINGALTVLVPH